MTAAAGVILYGPPASGKDTVTAALADLGGQFSHYRRLKSGPGRTEGYRMVPEGEIARLRADGEIVYSNSRYDAEYAIDRPGLTHLLAAGQIPILHVGQPEAVAAVLGAEPAARWVVVELWCPREVTAARSRARGTGDTAARVAAWDATPHLPIADVRIDTATVDPSTAARQIVSAVHASTCTFVVPTMHLVHPDGTLDLAATRRHAAAAADGWIDRFLLNGSTTAGDTLTAAERASVLDAWLEVVAPDRLLGCAWSADDLKTTTDRQITPMAVLKAVDRAAATQILRDLPPGATIYSHPMFGHPFDANLATWAKTNGCLPSAGKLAKVSLPELTAMHQETPEFAAWDGSSRRIVESVHAGAAGVVATPLAALLADLPTRSLTLVQHAIDRVQAELDGQPDRPAKRTWLRSALSSAHMRTFI